MFQHDIIEKTKNIIYQNNNETNIHTINILNNIFYHIENDINNIKLFKEKLDKVFLINDELTELYKKLGNLILYHYNKLADNKLYKPRDYQEIIIKKAYDYFQDNDKGLLVLTCGTGKTLISLWITQELNCNTILIGVPNKLLLNQWLNIILILFHNVPYLIISSGMYINDIIKFLNINNNKCIIITTYSSCHKVYKATQQLKFKFKMKINDECHHLTKNNMTLCGTTKTFIEMLNISSEKQLSVTATMKEIENDSSVSNTNINYFGHIIDQKCLLWAISQNIICDYVIQTIISDLDNINIFNIDNECDLRLFLSAFVTLKSIQYSKTHHVLIYSNNKENSIKICKWITKIIEKKYFNIPELYYSNYNGDMRSDNQKEILDKFEKSKYGIISCVYCLGEGYDLPLLDGVVFAENMSSNIRIVQSALRASRKNKNEPNKITKIILPVINNDWLDNNENSDFKKVKQIIYQMGLEDETIMQKIKVLNINIEKETETEIGTETETETETDNLFGYYNDELTEKLKLKTMERTILGTSYEKAKRIIADKNIKSKLEYYKLCDIDNRLSKEPEIIYKGKFKNWIEYLNIPRIYYDIETCKKKINEYLILKPELRKHYIEMSIISNELCKIDKLFPPNELWIEYYEIKDLRDIIIIPKNKKNKGVII
jgi:superfamily II DNA or RNA helicase